MPSQVFENSFYSPALRSHKKYLIYLPPSFALGSKTYPVLYLMAGLLDYERTWVEKGFVHEASDRLLAQGRITEMVIVMPDKDNCLEDDAFQEAYTQYLSLDLVQHIEQEFPVLQNPRYRALEGLSVGAYWALSLGIYTPGYYKSISALSGYVPDTFYQGIRENLQAHRAFGTRFRLTCGTQEEGLIENNQDFHQYLISLGLSSEFYVNEGPHDWPLWKADISHSLQFHSYSFLKA
jgi:enterochelin esterase-like enzyme